MDYFDKVVLTMLYQDEGIFYLAVLHQCRRIETKEIPTIGVGYKNGKINLLINPEWFKKFSIKEQIAILKHEMQHLVFLHPLRREHRAHSVWNLACDIAINQHIEGLPKGTGFYPKDFKLPDNLTAEQYYELLIKNGVSVNLNGNGNEENNCDDHSKWDDINGNTSLATETVKEIVREAIARTEKNRGTIPGNLEDFIKELLTPAEVPWYDKVRRTLTNKIKSELTKYTWKKENRRGLITQGKTYRRTAPFLLAIDTSGSMTDEEIIKCAEQLLGICKKFRAPLPIMLHDTEVYYIGKVRNPEDMRKALSKAQRGGTDYKDVINKIQEKRLPIETIVWCTDLECTFPPKPKYNIIWVLPENSRKTAPYGTVIQINSSKIKK